MTFLKKYWYLFFLAFITAGLAVVTFVTSQKLTQKEPVAPTVPQTTPKASQACTISFAIQTITPTTTPSVTLTQPTTGTPTITPSLTITPTNSPTATPVPQCGKACSAGQTLANHTCANDVWVLSQCLEDGVSCTSDNCSVLPTSTPTPTAIASCNSSCEVDPNCKTGLVCVGGVCRNPSCTNKTNCTCDVAQATPTPVTPKVPVSGNFPIALGGTVIGLGALLLLIGLAL